MFFKPFYYRLPMRVRVWNLRRERREIYENIRLSRRKAKRLRRKPAAVKVAMHRARAMRAWGQLFDPSIPF